MTLAVDRAVKPQYKQKQKKWARSGLEVRSDVRPPGMQFVVGSILGSGKHSFIEIGHEIISMAILSLPLIQVGQLSVTVERICI